jgi:hypothetical protein
VLGELAARSFQRGGVGVVEDDELDVEFLCGDLEFVTAGTGDHDLVARVPKALRDGAT